MEAAFAVALAMGLRRGEICGLRWRDVNFETRTLKVEQTIQRLRAKVAGKAGYHIAEPKTERSRRALVVPEALIPILRHHRVRQSEARLAAGSAWHDSDLVFCNRLGAPIDPRSLLREFHAVLERANLPHIRFQDLRHSAASLLLAQGVSLRAIMELLGHSTITLTANTYSHLSREMVADAAAKMEGLFSSQVTK